jgi:elongator complex protein 3
MDRQAWLEARNYTPELLDLARQALEAVQRGMEVSAAVQRFPRPDGRGYLGKHHLVAAYRQLVDSGTWAPDDKLLARIRMKPVRTLSGVTTVTVLTKPYACPGKCVFCPTDVRMPKSYLPDEPGARRALDFEFDPYDQVVGRITALEAVGHPTDKIELLILGGTWSAYRRDYQEWFVKRCFDAMNEVESVSLTEAQAFNESAPHRNVGLVVETRPDHVDPAELAWFRYLGVTKVQMGAQSLDDHILALNQRGHTLEETARAVALLRRGGFKIVLHWMPNLLGATLESDRSDFGRLFAPPSAATPESNTGRKDDQGPGLCPDEIKIYPTQLLANAELYAYWERGQYRPYTTEELVNLIADIKPSIPRYCRVNRVIRDIPSTNVVEGNKRTSLRQDVHEEMQRRGTLCQCVRCREVRKLHVEQGVLRLETITYAVRGAQELFLSFVTPDDRLAGFLRLSLPEGEALPGLDDLIGAAIIREVHVYGQSLAVGSDQPGAAQHAGSGTRLLKLAEEVARANGYRRLAVIAAVGTRNYYLDRGFERGALYLVKNLENVTNGAI